MELRQLKYFLKVIECGSMGKAALELGIGTSALSQQLNKLEGELATRLLNRTPSGARPTNAGVAFTHHARLVLRQAEQAIVAAQQERTSGEVSIGLPPTTASVLALPLIQAMHYHYPRVRLHIVEALSGHLAPMLHGRQLDLAWVFHPDSGRRWSIRPLLEERLFLISARDEGAPGPDTIDLAALGDLPLIMPSETHGLRNTLASAFEQLGMKPNIVMEVDGLSTLMRVVQEGYGATIQPGAAACHLGTSKLTLTPITDQTLFRRNLLASLPDEELSPGALAARGVITSVVVKLVSSGKWPGARLVSDTTEPRLLDTQPL